MERKRKNEGNVAKECARLIGCGIEKGDNRGFAWRVRSDFRGIGRIYRRLSQDFGTSPLPKPLEWLWDNFYVIEGAYEDFRSLSLSKLRSTPLPFCDGSPRLFRAVEIFLSECEDVLDDEQCSTLLSALDSECSLTLREYFTARAVMSASVMSELHRILSAYLKTRRDEELYAKGMCRAITSLRSLSRHNFDEDALSCRTARILSQDPSGDFENMTVETRLTYLSLLCDAARCEGVSERTYAKRLLEGARSAREPRERHIGCRLYRYPRFRKVCYLACVIGIPMLLTALFSIFLSPVCLLAFLPLWEAVKLLTDTVFSKITKSLPLPRMEVEGIPDNSAVLVVITSLLCGEESDRRLFDRLERMYAACGEKNVFFGILGDLPDSKSATAPGDGKILDYAYGRIESLCRKYGNSFLLLERRRSWSKGEELFMGHERKRGAVSELISLLKGRSTTFSERSRANAESILSGSRIGYIVTLDSDTNLGLGAVRDMYSAMTHPLARPVIDKEKGIVSQGYGIMQPRCSCDISGAGATPFTRLFCGEGGRDAYASAAFEVYQSIFGEGIFCGKGIIDVDAFDEVINKGSPFPEDRILSHDCLEGAYLRSALINDLTVTDGTPKHELSSSKRRHRWTRGDVQNLPYLAPFIRNARGVRIPNRLGFLSKFKLFDNVRGALVPIFAFTGILVSAFCQGSAGYVLLAASTAYLLIPIVIRWVHWLLSPLFDCKVRRYFSTSVLSGTALCILRSLYLLCALPTTALSNTDAVLRSLFRMLISGKGLLEWQTAQQSDSGPAGLLLFVYKTIFAAFSGFLLFAFAPTVTLRLISVMWLAFPVIAYHTSFDKQKGEVADDRRDIAYRRYARDIWRYFEELVTEEECHLPPDNISRNPEKRVARRTSPTNIGLYLMSVLCARDFGFISTDELYLRLSDTVATLERLERYKGHFYNWYSTIDGSVLSPRYISTVDSGNLTACLIVLKEGLRELVSERSELLELISRVEALCEGTDYSFLYNSRQDLFYLGATVREDGSSCPDEGMFDLLMSEARTVSYIECARRNVPSRHWSTLSRPVISRKGFLGLASWTGTAFEYLMPSLFLPTFERTLGFEALHFAIKAQRSRYAKADGQRIWGISESGYASEPHSDYGYKAFGIPCLALKSGMSRELVISPYSSFLALPLRPGAALRNLERLSECGLYGRYGFFEAIDFTKGRSDTAGTVIQSFMSHHLGMSMCALCNAAFNGRLVGRFMSDVRMKCAEDLLYERIPVDVQTRKKRPRKDLPERKNLR